MNLKTTVRCAVLLFVPLAFHHLQAADRVDPSTLEGKVLFGYQGWFDCASEQVPGSTWSHWSRGVPKAETLVIDMYPDLSEFDRDELCAVPGMTIGGKPAYLFTSRNAKTVLRHFRWMKDYGLDGVLVQRFISGAGRNRASGDVVLKNIMAAAAATGRTFAIEYDISGGKEESFFQLLRDDWAYLVDDLKVTSHPNYLRHKSKPVLSVWGMGLGTVDKHPPEKPEVAKQVIEWFQNGAPPKYRVAYMGGAPARWRTLKADAAKDPGWSEVYRKMDVVQPWTVGRYRTNAQVDDWKKNELEPDVAELRKNGQVYMPVVFPGFSWYNLNRDSPKNAIPRNRGEFLWRQAYNAKAAGATVLKIAMFDEVNEATAMFKLAARRTDAPEQGFWLTLDADGGDLPSDWYLRLAGEITRAFHGEIPFEAALPEKRRVAPARDLQ
jgi:hypothetical protein